MGPSHAGNLDSWLVAKPSVFRGLRGTGYFRLWPLGSSGSGWDRTQCLQCPGQDCGPSRGDHWSSLGLSSPPRAALLAVEMNCLPLPAPAPQSQYGPRDVASAYTPRYAQHGRTHRVVNCTTENRVTSGPPWVPHLLLFQNLPPPHVLRLDIHHQATGCHTIHAPGHIDWLKGEHVTQANQSGPIPDWVLA